MENDRLFPKEDIRFFWLVCPPMAIILSLYNMWEERKAIEPVQSQSAVLDQGRLYTTPHGTKQ